MLNQGYAYFCWANIMLIVMLGKHYVDCNVLWDVYYTYLGFPDACFAQENKQNTLNLTL